MRRLLVAIVACLVVASPPLLAWHGKGHMAVAAVAYQLLNPTIRERVDSLLPGIHRSMCGATASRAHPRPSERS
jgi:hypothetical protein